MNYFIKCLIVALVLVAVIFIVHATPFNHALEDKISTNRVWYVAIAAEYAAGAFLALAATAWIF